MRMRVDIVDWVWLCCTMRRRGLDWIGRRTRHWDGLDHRYGRC